MMKLSLAGKSMLQFGICVVILLVYTLIESMIPVHSMIVERWVTVLFLILPAAAGLVLGLMSLIRREGRVWLALAGMVLNGLFALFHLALVLFAG